MAGSARRIQYRPKQRGPHPHAASRRKDGDAELGRAFVHEAVAWTVSGVEPEPGGAHRPTVDLRNDTKITVTSPALEVSSHMVVSQDEVFVLDFLAGPPPSCIERHIAEDEHVSWFGGTDPQAGVIR